MRYTLIMAGGSGTRLWPMSRKELPKQLIPFVNGKSLIEIAYNRLDGLIGQEKRYICAGYDHKDLLLSGIQGFSESRFLGEPAGRDTLNALAYSSAVIGNKDPDAVIAVFTADHIITPEEEFRRTIENGFTIIEENPGVLLTFGITPDKPATGYGYLQLGAEFSGGAKVVDRFREKPDRETADGYVSAGPQRYLWNSGMFIWKASTFLDCVRRYEPGIYQKVTAIADAWGKPGFREVIETVYPSLKKISVDYAVMEPASSDPDVTVAALPMSLSWTDIGSWPAYAGICRADEQGNAFSLAKHLFLESSGCLAVSSDNNHLIAGIGCEDLVVIHTENATLVCKKDQAEMIKDLYAAVRDQYGDDYI